MKNEFTAIKSGSFHDPSVWQLGKVPGRGDPINLSRHTVVVDQGRGVVGLLQRMFPRLFAVTVGEIDATEGGQLVVGRRDVNLTGAIRTVPSGTIRVEVESHG